MIVSKIWILFALEICFLVLPLLLFCDDNNSNPTGMFIFTLRNSNILWSIQLSSFFASLPMLFDSLLDYNLQYSGHSLVEYIQRMLYIAALMIPSILFLAYHACEDYYYFHVSITTFTYVIISALVYSTVKGVMIQEPNKLYLHALQGWFILYQFNKLLEEYNFYNQWSILSREASIILNWMSVVAFLVPVFCWMTSSFQLHRARSVNSTDYQQETHAAAISVAYGLYITFEAIWQSVDYQKYSWTSEAEKTLVGNAVARIIFTIIVTVLPGRITRINAVLSTESPLNIVHAGLEVLRSEFQDYVMNMAESKPLRTCEHLGSNEESPKAIAGSSLCEEAPAMKVGMALTESAETNVDTSRSNANNNNNSLVIAPTTTSSGLSISCHGNGRFDVPVTRVVKLFHGKLDWVIIAAKKKGVTFAVTDMAMCSEYAIAEEDCAVARSPSSLERMAWEDDLSLETVCLHIDVYKIDQVLRNLIVHALKFTSIGGVVSLKMSYRLAGCDKSYKIITKMGVDAVGVFRVEVVGGNGGITGVDDMVQFGALTEFNKEELRCEGGSGLSLWIARRIIYLHKGTMGCQYDVSSGTRTVFFELPLYPASSMSSSPPQFLPTTLQRSAHGGSVGAHHSLQSLPAMSMSALLSTNGPSQDQESPCQSLCNFPGVTIPVDSPVESPKVRMSPMRVSPCSTDSTIEDSMGTRIAATFSASSDISNSPTLLSTNPLRSASISISCVTDVSSKGSAVECEEKALSPPAPSAMKAPDNVDRNLPRPLRFLIVRNSSARWPDTPLNSTDTMRNEYETGNRVTTALLGLPLTVIYFLAFLISVSVDAA
eukprot:gene21393-27716_t